MHLIHINCDTFLSSSRDGTVVGVCESLGEQNYEDDLAKHLKINVPNFIGIQTNKCNLKTGNQIRLMGHG